MAPGACEDAEVSGLRAPVFVAALFLPAAIVLLPGLLIARGREFDGLYGQDAFGYVDYALGPLREAIQAGRELPRFALPPGYPLLVAVASMVFGPTDVLGQVVSLVAGAAVASLVALLALELWPGADRRVALLAGLIAAVAGQLWSSSVVAMSDTPALAAATLGTFGACRFHRTGRAGWLLVAAAALALAIEIRLVYGVVAAVFAAVALVRLRTDLGSAPARTLALAAGALVVSIGVLAPLLGPVIGAFGAGRPPPFVVELGVARFDLQTPLRSTFDTADGHLEYRFPMAVWYAIQPFQPYWLGFLGPFISLGVGDVLRARPRGLPEIATLIAWPVLGAIALVTYPYQNTRFMLTLLPPLAILAAGGIARAWARVAAQPRLQRPGTAVVVVLLVVAAAFAWRHTDAFVARQATDLAAIRELEAQVPPDTRLISLGATPALRHDGREVIELYYLTAAEVDALGSGEPTYVLVDAGALVRQWAGTEPGLAFERLRSAPGFAEVARAGTWSLFVVRP
jgi:4-amino-4-deoxy-L-arabinose transferase-like glycosyltransferase